MTMQWHSVARCMRIQARSRRRTGARCAAPLAFVTVEHRGAGTTSARTSAIAALVIVLAAVLVGGVGTGFGSDHPERVAGGVSTPPSTLRPEPATAPAPVTTTPLATAPPVPSIAPAVARIDTTDKVIF